MELVWLEPSQGCKSLAEGWRIQNMYLRITTSRPVKNSNTFSSTLVFDYGIPIVECKKEG